MSEDFESKMNEAAEQDGGGDQSAEGEVVVAPQKQKTGMLIVVGLVLIGGAVVFGMYKKNSPAAADAAPVDTSAQQTIDTFLSSNTNGVQLMQSMLRNTEKLVKQFLSYPTAAQIPLSELKTNPFRSHGENIPTSDGTDFAANKKRESERLAAIKAVQDLQLQSIIHSESRRACMVNNTLYQEGQQISVFTVEKITPKTVVVKSGAYRFELKMTK